MGLYSLIGQGNFEQPSRIAVTVEGDTFSGFREGGFGFGGVLVKVGTNWLGRVSGRDSALEEVEATVTQSRVEKIDDGSGVHFPEITFEYRYNGQTYESSNVLEGSNEPGGSRDEIEAYVEKYPRSERVTAYVFEGAPGSAFLESAQQSVPRLRGYLVVGIGLVVALGGVGVWAFIILVGL